MTRTLFSYLLGVAGWLVLWGAAFSVSALASRLRLHGSTRGDLLLTARDLLGAALALCIWSLFGSGDFHPKAIDWIFGIPAGAGTVIYLALTHCLGIRRIQTPNMYMQRHPLIPLRILSFVIFQQAAATLLLLDWHRRYAADGRALVGTALIFGLTHLGVACFGLPLRQAVLLTAGSALAMLFWGSLRLFAHSLWAPLLTHYLFYIGLACRHSCMPLDAQRTD